MSHRNLLAVMCLLSTACATAPPGEAERAPHPGISPAELVSSIADVAAGRNPAMREAGITLKSVEFKLLVGTKKTTGGKAHVIVLDAQASRESEISFLQTFVLEVPPAPTKGVAGPGPGLPEVQAFVESAMETAREIAEAASRGGLPQRLESVELVAKLGVSRTAGGGVSFTVPALVGASVGVTGSRIAEEVNTVKLVFLRVPG